MAIQASRITRLNEAAPREGARYVLYLMHQAMRAGFNPALELAVEEANARDLPVVVAFGLLDGVKRFPEANARHYAFLLQGLADAQAALERRGIAFVLLRAPPDEAALRLEPEAALVVLDHGYLTVQKRFREATAKDFAAALAGSLTASAHLRSPQAGP